MVEIREGQFGFVAGKGTIDAIFILRQLQEKYLREKRRAGTLLLILILN